MYKLISSISLLIRLYLSYITIETIPIFKNDLFGLILGQAFSICGILSLIAYSIVGRNYHKGDTPIIGAIGYFFINLVLITLVWLILMLLTFLKILPI